MSGKSVPIRLKAADPIQSFVEAGEEPRASAFRETATAKEAKPKEAITRTTLDLPKSLHKRMKLHCAEHEISLADYLRGLIEKDLA